MPDESSAVAPSAAHGVGGVSRVLMLNVPVPGVPVSVPAGSERRTACAKYSANPSIHACSALL